MTYSPSELMAVILGRNFRENEVVVMGAVPAMPLAAAQLAKAMHAPHLWWMVGGSGTINPTILPASSCDPALGNPAGTLPLNDVVMLEGRGDAFDVFCSGGLQIDAYGNCNLICIGDWARPKMRGPGTVGLPFVPAVKRSVIYTMAHNPRTLVEKVDFVSGPGHARNAEEARAYRQEGPSIVVTPLAVMDFNPDTKRMRLASTHPGVTVDQVAAATGFALEIGPSVPVTPAPTQAELETLRRIDAAGVLRR